MEYCLEKRLLANYYSLVTIDETNFEEIKKDIISGLSSSGVNMLYRKQMINQIREMEKIEFNILWEKVKKKLPSPYKNLDIFDIFIFSE